ncbi:MAG TPA: hypothetical protein VGO57_18015 [Verrucomicrobiae bacterium]|jgi:hypothetical protein
MINTPESFDKLPDELKNSLAYLRAQREVISECVLYDVDHCEKAAEWVLWMVEFDSPWAGFNHLKARIMEGHPAYISRKFNQLETFRRIVFRIARLEREACHVPRERWSHSELFTA